MFPVDFHMGDFKCLNAIANNESWLWHLRFGHLNFHSLENLSKRNLVNGLPHIHHPDQLCETCILERITGYHLLRSLGMQNFLRSLFIQMFVAR